MKQLTRQGVAIGFLLLMLVKAWVMPLLYLDYELRKDFIVANFCVNKNRPELNCDGKCYLAARLAAVQEQEEEKAQRDFMFKLLENITDCRPTFSALLPKPSVGNLLPMIFSGYKNPFIGNPALAPIFHPPQTA
ncbi:hypothetical protein [Arundinibacter roseus]|uniref:Uncharacterized protein n=1 Tax=Arundinibacter roseus TaxID=2070510 RepID=A0A4R4K7F6_9BACT|nr:hypothetical protein [Arundinibacter roseus]TDB63488.1 hypothetical protein EZE20_17180 [Arundinibacter roseus]